MAACHHRAAAQVEAVGPNKIICGHCIALATPYVKKHHLEAAEFLLGFSQLNHTVTCNLIGKTYDQMAKVPSQCKMVHHY